jgi:glycosyltransferase involved in cell wall biosynthesis
MSQTLVVIQPYVPAYRRPFFLALEERLQAMDVDLVVAVGRPSGLQAARRDEAELPDMVRLRERQVSIGSRSISYRQIGDVIAGADLVVLEQARRNLEMFQLLLGPRHGRRVALWGHGRTISREVSRWEHTLLDVMTRRADWFFAYTEAGAQQVVSTGFREERCTVVHNATDTRSLRDAIESVGPDRIAAFARDHDLVPASTALFAGGLDASKRIDFLLDAVGRIAAEVPGFRLLIAGHGVDESKILAAQRAGCPVILLGDCRGEDLAVAARASEMILMPGRVGLIAVDSFAMGLPIVTTDWPHHAPEFDYLQPGVDAFVAVNDPAAFARAAIRLFSMPLDLALAKKKCVSRWGEFSIEHMADRFASGVLSCLQER